MTKLTLAIRVDSSQKIGTGNIKRTILIANEFKRKNFKVYFVKTSTDYDYELEKLGFSIFHIKKKSNFENRILKFVKKRKISAYFTDLINSEIKVEKILKTKVPVFVFEDEINYHSCSLYFNPNVDINEDSDLIKKKISSEKNFLGKKYFVLSKIKKKRSNTNNKILVSFGGSDNSNQTEKVVIALKSFFNKKYEIYVCLGKNYKNKTKLKTKYQNIKNLKFFSSEHLSDIIYKFNFIIGSCGQSLLERIYLDKYSLSAITSNNQSLLAKKLKRLNFTKIINLSTYPKKIKINDWRKEIIQYLKMKKIKIDSQNYFGRNGVKKIVKIMINKINDKRI